MKKRVVARSPRTDRTATHRAGARPMPSGPRILSLKQVRFSILFLPAATAQAHGCQYQAAADAGAGEESTRPGFECRTPRDSITSASSWSGSFHWNLGCPTSRVVFDPASSLELRLCHLCGGFGEIEDAFSAVQGASSWRGGLGQVTQPRL